MAAKSSWFTIHWMKKLIGTPTTDIATEISVIDGYHDVPTADDTDNVVMRDVIGNKEDAAVLTVGTTATLMAYIKGALSFGRAEFERASDSHTGDTNYSTVVTVTGSGILYQVGSYVTGGANTTIKITIDGVVLTSPAANHSNIRYVYVRNAAALVFQSTDFIPYAMNFEYQDSLLVEHKTSDGSKTSTCDVLYGHDT